MNAAIVENNVVVNVIVIDEENWAAYVEKMSDGHSLIASDVAAIGFIYDPVEGSFSPPTVNGQES